MSAADLDARAERLAAIAAQAAVRVAFRDRKGHGGSSSVVYRQITPDELEATIQAACLVAIELDRKAANAKAH